MTYSRNLPAFIVCFFLLLSCSQHEKEQKKYKYLITASVRNCEGCQVELYADPTRDYNIIDSTVVKDGSFSFKGEVADSGFYEINLKAFKHNRLIPIDVYLPADSIHLFIDAKNKIRTKFYTRESMGSTLKYASVASTSPIQGEIDKYLLMRDSIWDKFFNDRDVVVAKFGQTYGSGDQALVQQWADSVENMRYRFANYMSYAADLFIRQGVSPEAATFAMIDNRNDRTATERFRIYYNALPLSYQNSQQGIYLDNKLKENEKRNRNNQRFVNSRIRNLDFAGKTPQGQEVDEDSIFKANELTLVEFWASWCGPCRMEMPKYYKLYQKYSNRGLGFIAVSLDSNYDKWVEAIAADGLKVHHISELKGGNGEEMQRFEIKGIPANMLIDASGKIVAVDISRIDLKNKLQQSL